MKKLCVWFLMVIMAIEMTACSPSGTTSEVTSENKTEDSGRKESGILPAFSQDATVEETVLVDESGIKITATALTYTSSSADVAVTLENNSDKNLTFTCGTAAYGHNSVNGFMIGDGYLNCDVTAGKNANETISFTTDALRLYGITEIADMELGFKVYDEDYEDVYAGVKELKTSVAADYEYDESCFRKTIMSDAAKNTFDYSVPYFTEEKLCSQSGIEVLSGGFVVNKDSETTILLEAKNTTDQTLYAQAGDVCVNGLYVYDYTCSADIINPGKTAILDIRLDDLLDENEWEIFGIDGFEDVTFAFVAADQDYQDLGEPVEIAFHNPDVKAGYDAKGTEIYNANDIRILYKSIVEPDSKYGSYAHLLLLVENNTKKEIKLYDEWDSFSINGTMMDALMDPLTVKAGSVSVLEIAIDEDDLEDLGIGIDGITEVEFTMKILDEDGDTIDQPVITISADKEFLLKD